MKRKLHSLPAAWPAIVATFIAPLIPIAAAPVDAAPLEQKAEPGRTYSSFDRPALAGRENLFPPGLIKFQDTDIQEVLKIYQSLSGRTVIRSGSLPSATITIENQGPISRREALQLLDTALAQIGITMIPQGAAHVKAVPQNQAPTESAPIPDLTPEQLPDCLSYMTYIVELKGLKANSVIPALTPFAKAPNSLVVLPDADLLILRDYSANVRRMLHVLERIERASKLRQGRDEKPGIDRIPAP